MAGDDEGFEAGFGGEGSEEAGVAFADREAGGEGAGGVGGFNGFVAEGDDVVGDVVVEPGENGSSLVGGRCERADQLGG